MTVPRVSVITPTYNQARFIEACIGSVLEQTVEDWEMIIVDDGSTDGTPDLAEAVADPRVRVLRLPHRGQGALHETYNAALGAARGGVIALLDGDDFWPAAKLERQLPLFDDGETVLAWGAGLYVRADGTPLRRVSKQRARRGGIVRMPLSDLFLRLTRENVVSPAVTVMVRTEALRRLGGFRQAGARHVVDSPTWLALCATAAGSASYLEEVLGCYRLHGAQTTALNMPQMVADRRSIVLAAVADLDPATRARLGWTDRTRRDVEAASALLLGSADLRRRRFRQARSSFASALRYARHPGDRIRAGVGMLSALMHVDLLGGARGVRDRAAALRLRTADLAPQPSTLPRAREVGP